MSGNTLPNEPVKRVCSAGFYFGYMINRLLAILAGLMLLMLVLPSCEGNTVCGGGPKRQNVDVEGLGLEAYLDDRLQTPVSAAGLVSALDLRLFTRFNLRLYGAAPASRGGFAAYADCVEPEYVFSELIDSVVVTSQYAYDARHLAGASLNDLVKVSNYYGAPVALTELLRTPQTPEALHNHYLTFSARPAGQGPQKFRVRYYQKNGEVYMAETVEFTLVP